MTFHNLPYGERLGHLLANREVHPEFAFTDHGDNDKGEGVAMRDKVALALSRALGDTEWRKENLAGQDLADRRAAGAGAEHKHGSR